MSADKPRAIPVSSEQSDSSQLARFLLSTKLKPLPRRDMYPYMLADGVNLQADAAPAEGAGSDMTVRIFTQLLSLRWHLPDVCDLKFTVSLLLANTRCPPTLSALGHCLPYLTYTEHGILSMVAAGTCSLRISGFSTGAHSFSVNNPVHIPGVGTFQLSSIEAAPVDVRGRKGGGMDVDASLTKVVTPDPEKLQNLTSENEVRFTPALFHCSTATTV